MSAKVRKITEFSSGDEQAFFSETISDVSTTIVEDMLQAHERKNLDANEHEPQFFNRNWHSNTTHCYVRQFLSHSFPDRLKVNRYDRISLVCGNFMIFFKKFDDRFLPRNVKTGASEKIQQRIKFIEEYSLIPVYIGYREDGQYRLTDIHAISYTDRKMNWKTPLYQSGGENLQDLFSDLTPFGPDIIPVVPAANIKAK